MGKTGRILAIDYGEKRIGVAISDIMGIIAQPLDTIQRKDYEEDLKNIKNIIKQNSVVEVVIGLPKNMDGRLGDSAMKIVHFVSQLRKAIDLPIRVWDERLTTAESEKLLIESDVSRKKRRKKIDKIAASLILQGYLENKTSHNKG